MRNPPASAKPCFHSFAGELTDAGYQPQRHRSFATTHGSAPALDCRRSMCRHRGRSVSKTLLLLALLGLSAACAGRNRPPGGIIVDMDGVDPARYRRDLDECTAYAKQVDATGKVSGNAAGGAVVGGAIGAIFGGGEGAARGAGAGAV